MIEGHGDDLYRYDGKININFSSNIFQGIDHKALKEHLGACLDVISNYPEAAPFTVELLLSSRLGIPIDNIMATNGAAEAIHLIARTFQECRSTILQPTFAEYADACSISKHTIASIDDIENLETESDIVWLCNPNNPTGKAIDCGLLLDLIKQHPNKIFVIDQAYHKYTNRKCLLPTEILRHRNLILLYSMTKDYAIPGLRLGYILADPAIINSIKRYRIPWSVNALAIEAAKHLLTSAELDIGLDSLLKEAQRVSIALNELGISVLPSDTNFMLCKLPNGKACELKEYLVDNFGILIRDASNFAGLTPGHFRIAVQSPENNDLLINAIKQWMHS